MSVKTLFTTLSVIFGAIPGLAVLITGIGAPPGRQIYFGALVESFGALALLLIFVNRGKLKRTSKKRITRAGIICASAALVCLLAYLALMRWCVVTGSSYPDTPVYYSLWLEDPAATVVQETEGRGAAINAVGPKGMQNALAEMAHEFWIYLVTDIVILLTFLSFFTLLTSAFGVPGAHLAELVESPANRNGHT